MNKDAYYFPHDSNAKDDPKCIMLIEELGAEGYGIFWILIETLRDQPGYKAEIRILPAIARRYNTTTEKVKAVVMRYELFLVEDEKFFFSPSLIERMKPLEAKREQRRLAGIKSGEARRLQAKNERTMNDRSTDDEQVKESKVKKSKVKKSNFKPPELIEVQEYMMEYTGNDSQAERFVDFYESKGWYVGKNKMKDWKAAARNWLRSDKPKNNDYATDGLDTEKFKEQFDRIYSQKL